MKPLIIVGIDPGTTLAYAILDLDGNVLRVSSSKQLDMNSLTANIYHIGKPLIAATDVNPAPKFVEKFSAVTGSRIVKPKESLKVEQKKELAEGQYFTNDHELDALASAIFAFKRVRALLRKIDFFLKKHKKEDLKREVVQLVFSKRVSISDAIAALEKKEPSSKVRKPKMRTEPIKVKFNETKYLREVNERLKAEISRLEGSINNLKTNTDRIANRRAKDLSGFKDKKIMFLTKELEDKKAEVMGLKEKVSSMNGLFFKLDNYLVVPKFKSLSFDELNDAPLKGVIFVEDPNVFSEKTLDILKGRVSVIIFSKPVVSKTLASKFLFINAKDLNAIVEDKFVLVDKSRLESEKDKANIFARVVEDYARERN